MTATRRYVRASHRLCGAGVAAMPTITPPTNIKLSAGIDHFIASPDCENQATWALQFGRLPQEVAK
jgi:hypothetical protein